MPREIEPEVETLEDSDESNGPKYVMDRNNLMRE